MKVKTVAVVGAGAMGRGIAQCFAEHDYCVIFYAFGEKERQDSMSYINRILDSLVSKGRITPERRQQTLENIQSTIVLENVRGADLIVETVVEDLQIKQKLLQELDRICRPDAIFTTNTSSIRITDLASVLRNPSRMCGMHFFYPPSRMPVIEIPVSKQSCRETIETVKEVIASLEKRGIEVKESPGFIFNRLIIPFINEAAYLLSENAASREDIDSMMKLAASHPIGPLQLGDIIGLDVCLYIMEVLWRDFGDEKYRPCPLLREKVARNELGRKTGKGFYEYPQNSS